MNNKSKNIRKQFLLYLFICLTFFGCEDFVEIDTPRTETGRETVFSSDVTADAAMAGIYIELIQPNTGLLSAGLELTTGLLCDELVPNTNDLPWVEYATNQVEPNNATVFGTFWRDPYAVIYNANAIIEGVTDNNSITIDLRNQFRGEALFIRALMHFYITNLFGAVPYAASTDVETNNGLSREAPRQIYEKIVADLREAQTLMFEDYKLSEGFRARANRYVATALLARIYLYKQDWTNAEATASEVISQSQLYAMETVDSVFLTNNQEAIFQLASINSDFRETTSPLGDRFVIFRTPVSSIGLTSLDENYLAIYDSADLRFSSWVGSFNDGATTYIFPNKYKNYRIFDVGPPERTVVLMLAEQYLIRAEARARLNNLAGAIEDLDIIRGRAQITLIADSIPAISQSELLKIIERERQREFIAEGGHRWFDLKRTDRADPVLRTVKESWETTDVLLPIPETELAQNSNLLPQNEGY